MGYTYKMKNLVTYVNEYIVKKKLDHFIDSSVLNVYDEIDNLINLNNYDKKIRDCIKKWIDKFDVKSVVYYTRNKKTLSQYLDINLIEDKLMSEDEFIKFKENLPTIDIIQTPKVTIKTCSNYIYVNFRRSSLYIMHNNKL